MYSFNHHSLIFNLLCFYKSQIKRTAVFICMATNSWNIRLFELNKHYKLTHFENGFSEQQNIKNVNTVIQNIAKGNYTQDENSFSFVYQKSWWRTNYKIIIFAGENIIAINAEGIGSSNSGFIDFGASKKIEKKIIDLLIKNTIQD